MTQRRTFLLWTPTLILLGSLFAATFREGVRAAPVMNPAQDNIVISEFRTRGEGGIYDEFIELFNPTGQDIEIGGWSIRRSSGCGASTYDLAIIASSVSLAPGQHYLVASAEATDVSADQTYTPNSSRSIVDNGGIALFDPGQSQPVDSVGMCATTLYVEGINLDPLTTDVNRSFERGPGGISGNCTDSDNNKADFNNLIDPSNPQNSYSPLTTGCIPAIPTSTNTSTDTPLTSTATLTSTPTLLSTATRTSTPTLTSTIDANITPTTTSTPTATSTSLSNTHLVISEFRTRGPNGGEDEFIELYNPTGGAINISGWMVKRSSSCGSTIGSLATIPAGITLQPGQHYLLLADTNSSLNGADQTFPPGIADEGGIALLNSSSIVIDQVGMCADTTYHEGTYLTPLSGTSDQSYERKPGGANGSCYDTDDNLGNFARIAPSLPQNLASAPVACSGGSTPTPTFTATPTRTQTSSGSAITVTPSFTPHILISEFRTRGPNGADDEFVELYNPTGGSVNIGGWTVRRSASCGSTVSSLITITAGMIIQPGQHYLILSNTNSSLSDADQTFSPAIADDGGIALLNTSSTVIDQVGMCADTAYHAGTNLNPLSGTANQSYERRPGGSTSCYDTNNNINDFQLISPSNPQNRASPSVMCAGVLTYTPTTTFTITRTPTRTSTPVITVFPGFVVLNEFLPHPASDWNGDGEANSRDEYIELINMGVEDINIKNWKLDDIADGGSSPYTLPDMILTQYQIVRFYASETGISLSDGGDTVRLIKPDGHTADLVNYNVVTASDRTWCRLPDGNGAWAFVCFPTPGRPNALAGTEPPAPDEEQPEVRSNCLLPDTVPDAFWLAECGSSGGDIWERKTDQELWLENHWKWEVFVE